ncbi:MAG: site-specific DNA-methyltransferase [Thermoplasmata archaeon]|nr:site-specific DNA-methyltransferase [Thermoplasmata archaeon]
MAERRGPQPYSRLVHGEKTPITLYRADCLALMPRLLTDGSVDVVVTSPPYNLGVRYSTYRDDRPRAEYLRWCGRVGKEVGRVLSEGGSFFLNVGGPPRDPWLPWDVAREVGRHLVLQNVLHWVKSIVIDRASAGALAGLDRDLAVGHYKPVGSRRYLHSAHEYVFHFSHRGDVLLDRLAVGVPYQDKSNVRRWKGSASDLRCRGNTWFLPYPTIRRRTTDRPHPAAFPTELPERCLKLHGLASIRLALDPFLGIGASALAAARLGVPFTGIDLDAGYLGVARDRLLAEGWRPEGVARPTPVGPTRPRRSPTVK